MGNAREDDARVPAAALRVLTNDEPLATPTDCIGRLALDAMRRHAASLDIPAQIDFVLGRSLSFPELLSKSTKAALGWRALGVTKGQTLAVMSSNCHLLYPAFFGAVFEAVTIVFIPPSTENELQHFLSVGQPTAFLTDEAELGMVLKSVDTTMPVVVASENAQSTKTGHNVYSVTELMARGSLGEDGVSTYEAPEVPDLHQHVSFGLFSSGTTGLPKMVKISSYSHSMILAFMVGRFVLPGDRVLITTLMSWVTGLSYTVASTMAGATRVYGATSDAVALLDAIQDHKITTGIFGATRIQEIAEEAVRRRSPPLSTSSSSASSPPRLGCVRALLATGSPLRADVHGHCVEALGAPVVQAYGMTEVGILTWDRVPPRPGSVGRITPQTRIRLVDPDSGLDVSEPNAVGELRATAPPLMSGYHGDADATRQSFDEHGFFRSGDLAYRDEDGYVFIVGRIKEIFKYNNRHISPAELEAVLESHPAVREACVVGRPDATFGDLPAAFVVKAEGKEVTVQELHDLIRDRVVNEKWLRGGVYFVDEISKSTNGKVQRRKLVESLPPLRKDDVVDV